MEWDGDEGRREAMDWGVRRDRNYRACTFQFTQSTPHPPTQHLNTLPHPKHSEYFFQKDNLCRDTFLRSHLDEEGWVPLALICNFPTVSRSVRSLCVWVCFWSGKGGTRCV